MRVIGVDEHVWRHTPYGDKYVTVILDLTPIRDRSGPSRLLDMVPGRSKKVFKTWLASQPDTWRERIEIVAMDGFTGFKSAAAEELPDARAVMDPFHVVHLAGNALDECRRRIQQELHHRRGRATDPLYKARRMLHTRSCLLTARQQHQILDLFSNDEHVALEVTWSVYQNIIDAYRSSNARGGKTLMHEEITRLTSTSVPSSLTELITLGRTLKRRATDILAYFDNPHTSNDPTEAINGRLEHLRGSALGFRNLTHYITRALLETGGFKPQLHPQLSRAGLRLSISAGNQSPIPFDTLLTGSPQHAPGWESVTNPLLIHWRPHQRAHRRAGNQLPIPFDTLRSSMRPTRACWDSITNPL